MKTKIAVTSDELAVIKKSIFLRMADLCNRSHQTHGMGMLVHGEEIIAMDALFRKLFGEEESARCRQSWDKIANEGQQAFYSDLANQGFSISL